MELNENQEPDKAPFIVYTNLEYRIEKIDRCKTNLKNSSTTRDLVSEIEDIKCNKII